jgi:hypothetical protein
VQTLEDLPTERDVVLGFPRRALTWSGNSLAKPR